jgi:hypothetical protein
MGANSPAIKFASKDCADGSEEGIFGGRRLADPKINRADDESERTSKAKL